MVDVRFDPDETNTTTTTATRRKRAPGCRPRLRDSMLAPEATATRSASFTASSSHIREYDYHSWVATTFILRARAPSNFIYPWMLCVFITIAWVTVTRKFSSFQKLDLIKFERVYALIFTALGFLLVFRLTRAAVRYWDCRTAWGTITVRGEAERVVVDRRTVDVNDATHHKLNQNIFPSHHRLNHNIFPHVINIVCFFSFIDARGFVEKIL